MMDVYQFWEAVLRQDRAAIRSYFHPEAEILWRCSGERFTLEEYIRANCDYPGEWTGEVERAVACGDMIITAAHVHTKDNRQSFHAVSFLRIREGKILSMEEYWGEDGPPPLWRQEMGIGTIAQ